MRGREPQPLAADVVNVSEDGSDGTSLAPGRLGAPRAGVEMLKQELVHPVVDGVGLQQRLAKVHSGGSSEAGHRTSLSAPRLTESVGQCKGAATTTLERVVIPFP